MYLFNRGNFFSSLFFLHQPLLLLFCLWFESLHLQYMTWRIIPKHFQILGNFMQWNLTLQKNYWITGKRGVVMKDKESLNSSLQLQMEGTSSLVLISTSSWNKFSLSKHLEGMVGVKSTTLAETTEEYWFGKHHIQK